MKVMKLAVALEKASPSPLAESYPLGRSYPYLGKRSISVTHSPGSPSVSRFIEVFVERTSVHGEDDHAPLREHNPAQFREDLAELGFFDSPQHRIAREVPRTSSREEQRRRQARPLAHGIRILHHDTAASTPCAFSQRRG